MKKKIKIKLVEWVSHCSDGCCSDYGVQIYLNDELLEHPEDEIISNAYIGLQVSTSLKAVLKKLGYEVEIEETYED